MWPGFALALIQVGAAFPALHPTVSSRVLLTGGLLLVLVVTAWYWSRLGILPRKVRLVLVGLRFTILLILVLIISDLSVVYQTATSLHVFVGTIPITGGSPERMIAENDAKQRTVSALRRNQVDAVNEVGNGAVSAHPPTPVIASVIISDGGVISSEAQRIIEAGRAATGGGPVYVVTDLNNHSAPQVSLSAVTVTGPVFRGVPASVIGTVHAQGMAGRETTVTIADTAQVRSSAKIAWTGDDETQTVDLEVVPKVAGWIDYTASVEPPAGVPVSGRQVSVYVNERQWRVMIFEGEPTSESNFIRRGLELSGLFNVDYFAQVSRNATVGSQPRPGAPVETNGSGPDSVGGDKSGSSGSGPPSARLHSVLADPARLTQYDCIIVGPTPNTMLSVAESDRVRQWVDRRGGGLIILGGNNFTGSIVAANGRLASILPATIDASSFGSSGGTTGLGHPVEAEGNATFALVPTLAGAEGALRGFVKARDAVNGKRDVLGLALRLGAPRAGGAVLAVGGDAQTKSTDQGRALIAAAQFGSGRVVLFAPADSFKLRVNEPDQTAAGTGPFDSLWRGLTLWAAAGSRPASELVLNEDSPATNREVVVELRIRDTQFAPANLAKVSANWQNESNDAATGYKHTLDFLPDGEQPGIWRARFTAPLPGKYSMQATATSAGGTPQHFEKQFAVVPATPLEPGTAGDTLDRLARESGGQVFALKDVDQLAARLAALPRDPETAPASWRLRDFWPLAFLLPLLLAAEWLIHRLKL